MNSQPENTPDSAKGKNDFTSNLNSEKHQLVSSTYQLYTNQAFSYEDLVAKGITPKNQTKSVIGFSDQKIIKAEDLLNEKTKEKLNHLLEGEKKSRIEAIFQEMNKEEVSFFGTKNGFFSHKTEEEAKKISQKNLQMEVPLEIKKMNIAAIFSCMEQSINKNSGGKKQK